MKLESTQLVTISGAQFEISAGFIKGSFNPIPLTLWRAIMGFHRQVSINLNGESVSYHKWNAATGSYHTIIPWQQTSIGGLSVRVNWENPENEKLLNHYASLYGEDFFPACTIHTHVDVNAFESGTDASDETSLPGWHITLGNLISHQKYSLHFRMRMPRLKRIKHLVNPDFPIIIDKSHLFVDEPNLKEVLYTDPGTIDFHQFLERVS